MRVPGLTRVRRAAAAARRWLAPEPAVLMYHRVAEPEADPFWLAVTPAHFAEHLEVLRRGFHPVPLARLDDPGYRPRPGRREVVLTFDDGYVDNLLHARPLLERYGVPATVFVTTGYVGRDWEFWWDELEKLILRPADLPETFRLGADGSSREWHPGDAARYTEDDHRRDRGWNCGQTLGPRQRLLFALVDWIRPLPEGEQRQVLGQLAALIGPAPARPGNRAVTPDELVRLGEGGLVEIGAHTMTHPSLAAHPAAVQRDEIARSKAGLEDLLGRPVARFAYPFGTPNDYTPETVGVLRELGFRSACVVRAGRAGRDADRLQLPRFVARDWDGETFARELEGFFDG